MVLYLFGAIVTLNHTVLSFNGTTNFINNSADYGLGGAIYALDNIVLSLSGTNNFITVIEGGAIYTKYNIVLSFSRTNNLINNSAGTGGGAIAANNTVLSFNGMDQ